MCVWLAICNFCFKQLPWSTLDYFNNNHSIPNAIHLIPIASLLGYLPVFHKHWPIQWIIEQVYVCVYTHVCAYVHYQPILQMQKWRLRQVKPLLKVKEQVKSRIRMWTQLWLTPPSLCYQQHFSNYCLAKRGKHFLISARSGSVVPALISKWFEVVH